MKQNLQTLHDSGDVAGSYVFKGRVTWNRRVSPMEEPMDHMPPASKSLLGVLVESAAVDVAQVRVSVVQQASRVILETVRSASEGTWCVHPSKFNLQTVKKSMHTFSCVSL